MANKTDAPLENSFYQHFDDLMEGCQIIDQNYRYLYVNNVVAEHARLPKEQLQGRAMLEVFPDLENTPVYATIRRCMEDRIQHQMENEFAFADGSMGWFDLRFLPVPEGVLIFSWDITERKRDEALLRQSRNQFSEAMKMARAGYWEYDMAGDTFTFNDHFYRIFRTTAEEVGGYQMSSAEYARRFCHPDDAYRVTREGWADIEPAADAPAMFEHRILYADGEIGHITVCFFTIKDDQGHTVKLFGVNQDITERKRMEKSIRENESRLRTLVETIPDLVWLKDENGVFLSCNKKFECLLGVKEEDIVGKTDYDFVDKALADFFMENDRRAIAAGKPTRSEEWVIFADDGQRVLLDTIKTPMIDNEGNLVGVLGVGRDITDRKEHERILARRERKYRTILQTAIDGFWISDLKGKVLEVNDAYCRMSGYTEDELLSMSIPELEGNLGHDEIASKIEEVVNQGYNRFETKHRRKDGSLYCVEVSVKYLSTEGGRLVIFLRDIDALKKAEQENRGLQAQLLRSQKMESIGRLAGGIAHDFNNMLSVIIGHGEFVLEQTRPTHSTYPDLQEIINAAQRSADIIRQLLAFARRQAISPRVLDINKVVDGTTKFIKRLIGEDIDLVWLPGKAVWPVKLDPGQIDQVLANLCVNARDAIADVGRITIETRNAVFDEFYGDSHPEVMPGEYVQLTVSDTGHGMDSQTVGDIFEPFFTTKETGKGTGLGLATVYGIVKQNNGFINVYSEPGRGTTFKMYVPRYRGSTGASPDNEEEQSVIGGHETILVVEDELPILNMTKIMLEKQGYTVISAWTPDEAVSSGKKHAADISLLITDVVMPGMNGKDLYKNILSICPNLKCLFMSGYTADVIAHHGVLEKGVNFIQKPFSKKELGTKVRQILNADTD